MTFSSFAADEDRTLADRWFRALDQRRIRAGAQRWTAQVVGVHVDFSDVWIQIASLEAPDVSLVLHMSERTTLHEAITAMRDPRHVEGMVIQVDASLSSPCS